MNEKVSSDTRKRLGDQGETLALEHLLGLNYVCLHANWRCKSGELDLIMRDASTLVFVEVRTRRNTGRFGTPQESVNIRKQRKVREIAQVYLHHHHQHDARIRFDLVSIEMNIQGEFIRLEHLPYAF